MSNDSPNLSTNSLWHINDRETALRDENITVRNGQLLLEGVCSLVSAGTELLIARGGVPAELYDEMRVPHMGGNFSFPVKYGYSWVGRDVESDTYYHIMCPHQRHCAADPAELFEIPDDIPSKRAALASNLETALNAIWDARVTPGERVLVVGFGLIGSLVTRLAASIPATTVEVSEIHPWRQDYCKALGFTLVEPQGIKEPYDVVFHCSGTGRGLQTSIDRAGREGRIIELSWYGNARLDIHLGGDFHNLRKRIISSQVSHIPSHMSARWDLRRRKRAVFEILRNPAYDMHITDEIPLSDAPRLFEQWRQTPPEALCYLITYQY